MLDRKTYEFNLNGVPFKLETGEIANHAQSALVVSYGETTVLVVVTVGEANPSLDFFPLTVDFVEKLYAGGLISSSPYIKREGRPTDNDILSGRLIDHAIRSLFPSNFRNETQVIAQVLSFDGEHDPVIASIIGTSFALSYSGLPFLGPYGATRVGQINNELILNPELSQMHESTLEMVVSSTEAGIISVEAEAHNVADEIVKEGIKKAAEFNSILIAEQKKFLEVFGVKAFSWEPVAKDIEALSKEVAAKVQSKLEEVIYIKDKMEREAAVKQVREALFAEYEDKIEADGDFAADLSIIFEKINKKIVRKNILESSKRPDGRSLTEVRPIQTRVGVLPRVHGSALFTRGESQSLTIVTLGSDRDALHYQDMTGEHEKRYFHHYNMPGYANGEVDRKFGFANRRAIGHGIVGEKALRNMIASSADFPYTIRVVSEITSSNGSTSMAATCASTLALMDAGVPVKKIIGGIGVGLVYESGDNYKILTDIIGLEDFYGDMDFKITGSVDGITAIQLDNKMSGIPIDVLIKAIDQSKEGRLFVISQMEKTITDSRTSTSQYAPKVKTLQINPEKIGELIGPGGKVVKSIIEKTGVEVNIEDDGTVMVYSRDEEGFQKAISMINAITQDLVIGQEYDVEVVRVETYGVFVEIPNTKIQGLVHVTNLGLGYVKDLRTVVQPGQTMRVVYSGKDEKGRVKFAAVQQAANQSNATQV